MKSIVLALAAALVCGSAALAQQKSSPTTGTVVKENPCLAGYQFYPDKGQCIELKGTGELVERAKCIPGEERWVDDPNRAGGKRRHTCGFVKSEAPPPTK